MLRLFLVFTLASSTAAFGQLDQQAPPELEVSLRETVTQFYTFFQKGRFREAEDLVDHESKDLYYDAAKQRIMSFELRQVSWAEDFRQADVLVAASWVLPMMGNAPVPVPLASDWRLVDGVWRLHLESPSNSEAGYVSPAGPMKFSDEDSPQLGTPGALTNAPRPTIEALAGMYEVSEKSLSFQRRGEGLQTREVSVKNKARGSLSVELTGQTTGVEVSIEPKKFKAGEEARILVSFDPAVGSPTDQQTLRFLVMPIRQQFELLLDFQ